MLDPWVGGDKAGGVAGVLVVPGRPGFGCALAYGESGLDTADDAVWGLVGDPVDRRIEDGVGDRPAPRVRCVDPGWL